jgi:telomerase reverse transcriptase
MLSNEDYVVQKFTRVGGVAGYRHSIAAQALEDTVPFYPNKCAEAAHATRHEVLVDSVERNVVQATALKQQLQEHVKNNLVRIGNKVYRQISGIPQGSCMSSLLINMHYTVLESLCVPPRARNHLWLLLRLVDDWLLLTTDAASARAFMRNLSSGHPEFGCSVSAGKSSANFGININGESVRRFDSEGCNCVSWCGLLIDVKTLEIRLDYSRFFSDGSFSRHLRDSVSVETSRNPGQALRAQTIRFARLRAHGFLFDRYLNSDCTAMENCFAVFAHTAMRFHASWMLLLQATGSLAQPSWIVSVVQATIRGVCATVRGRVAQIHKGSADACSGESASHSLCKSDIACLGLHAFIAVFKMRSNRYSVVIPALRLLLLQQHQAAASEGEHA